MKRLGTAQNSLAGKGGLCVDELKRRQAFDQDLKGDGHVLAGEVHTRTGLHAPSEGEALVALAREIEFIRPIENARVSIGSRHGEENPAMGRNIDPVEDRISFAGESRQYGDRRFPAKTFFAGRFSESGILAKSPPQRAIRENSLEEIAQGTMGRFSACGKEQPDVAVYLLLAEFTSIDLDLEKL